MARIASRSFSFVTPSAISPEPILGTAVEAAEDFMVAIDEMAISPRVFAKPCLELRSPRFVLDENHELCERPPSDAFRKLVVMEGFEEMRDHALAAGGRETGGILIGRYDLDGNSAIVPEATIRPKDSRSGRAWFQRGIHGLKDMLRNR